MSQDFGAKPFQQGSSAHPSKTETCELRGDYKEHIKSIVENVVEQLSHEDGIDSVWRTNRHICHNVDENILFDIPRAGVERKFKTNKSWWGGRRRRIFQSDNDQKCKRGNTLGAVCRKLKKTSNDLRRLRNG